MQVMQEKHFGIDAEATKGASSVKGFLMLGFQLVAGYDPIGMRQLLLFPLYVINCFSDRELWLIPGVWTGYISCLWRWPVGRCYAQWVCSRCPANLPLRLVCLGGSGKRSQPISPCQPWFLNNSTEVLGPCATSFQRFKEKGRRKA